MKTLNELQDELTEIQKLAKAKQEEINLRLAETIVLCMNDSNGSGCGHGFYIKDLTYMQSHWYESPHGCTGGDNWHMGEGRFTCPACGKINRLYNKPDVQKLNHLFKNIIDVYDNR